MVRYMRTGDRQDFLAMAAEFYGTSAVPHPVPKKNFETTFDQILAGNPFVRGIMVTHEDRAAGYALLALTYSNEVGGLVVFLEEAYLRAECRGLGLGTAVFEFVEREFPEAKRFRLEVTQTNERAVALYKRLGYQPLDYLQMIKDKGEA